MKKALPVPKKSKVKIPNGWRKLPKGTVIQIGDKCPSGNGGWWVTLLAGQKVGWDYRFKSQNIYIRKTQGTQGTK